jgi:hypothetical protein
MASYEDIVIIVPVGERVSDTPPAIGEISLESTSYSMFENNSLLVKVNRAVYTNQVVSVDYTISGVPVTNPSGTLTFSIGQAFQYLGINSLEVPTTQVGSIQLSNPQYISGGAPSQPILGSPSSASLQVNDTGTPLPELPFPRLGVYQIGSWGTAMQDDARLTERLQNIAKHDIAILGGWKEWNYSAADATVDMSTLVPYLKTFNSNIVVYKYVIYVESDTTSNLDQWVRMRAKLYAESNGPGDWWLRDAAGNQIQDFGTTLRINHSDAVDVDAHGWTFPEWQARLFYFDGGNNPGEDYDADGYGHKRVYGWDGIWLDVMDWNARVIADWNEDGVNELKDSSLAITFMTTGHVDAVNAWKAMDTGFLIGGNYAANCHVDDYANVPARMFNLVNAPLFEHSMGRSFGAEAVSTEFFLRFYKNLMTFSTGVSTRHELVDANTEIIPVTHTEADWCRYGLCLTLQDNGFFGMRRGPTAADDAVVINEYDYNLGQALSSPDYGNTPSGYNEYQNGVYLREFENGLAIVNPNGNGTQTITLPDPGAGYRWDRLGPSDFDDPLDASLTNVNDGAINVTSQTIEQRHGVILKRVLVPASTTYPRLAICAIGGWSVNDLNAKEGGMAGRFERLARHDLTILGTHRVWEYTGTTGPYQNRSTICSYIKSFNPNILIYNYTLGGTDIRDASPVPPWPETRVKWDVNKWYLYDGTGTSYPDDIVRGSSQHDEFQGIGDSGVVGVDSVGVGPAEWSARAEYANETDTDGDWVTAGWGLRKEYGFDGVYQDIMRYVPREHGDWDADGSVELRESVEALTAKSNGDHQYHAEWDRLEPEFIHSGNYTRNVNPESFDLTDFNLSIQYGYKDFVNGAFMEAIMGHPTASIESFGHWEGMMRYYKRAMYLVENKNPSHVFFDCWQAYDIDLTVKVWGGSYTNTDFGRYGLCSCLQDDGYFGYANYSGFSDAIILNEYDFDLGAAIDAPKHDGSDVTTSISGSGYIAYQNGVHLREFENGLAIVNPKNNGTQTITLPSPGAGYRWDRLGASDFADAVQDSDVNDGATDITSQTLPERHGIIIKRTQIPGASYSYPRLGCIAIGGWSSTGLDNKPGGMPGRLSRIAAHDIALILSGQRGWSYGGSTGPAQDVSSLPAYIKSFNPNITLYFYTNVVEVSDSRAAFTEPYKTFYEDKADQLQWWLYDGTGYTGAPYYQPAQDGEVNPASDVMIASAPYENAQTNGADVCPTDSNGLRATEWFANAFHANSGDPGDWATSGYGFRKEYGYDGIYQDVMRYRPRTSGDFDRNGSFDDKEGSVAQNAKWQACKRYHDQWTQLEPTFLHAGNLTYNGGTGGGTNWIAQYSAALALGYDTICNAPLIESLMGGSSSMEAWGGWDMMMRYYKRMMTLADTTKGPAHTWFDTHMWHDSSQTSAEWGGSYSEYDFGRYALCSCMQDEGFFGYANYDGFTDTVILDEFNFDLGDRVGPVKYDGADPATSNTGSGYIPYYSGVYLSEFENGLAIVNPKGNGTKTIPLPDPGVGYRWDRLDATDYDSQDIDTNDGATNVMTQTLLERHGIILKRTNVPTTSTLIWPQQGSVSYIPAVRNRNAASASVIAAGRGYGMSTRHAYSDWNVQAETGDTPNIVRVTNLQSTGAGSLHDALENAQDRTIIVFDVAGKIICDAQISVTASKIWVAGQTAPGLVWVQFTDTEELVRITTGTEIEIYTSGSVFANIVVDHCFFGGGSDEVFSVDNRTHITAVDCVIAKARGDVTLNHAYGTVAGDDAITWVGNFYSTMDQRAPLWKPHYGTLCNNLATNTPTNSLIFTTDDPPSGSQLITNIVGHCHINQPVDVSYPIIAATLDFTLYLPGTQIYINDCRQIFNNGTERAITDEWDAVLPNSNRTEAEQYRVNSVINNAWPEGLVAAECRSRPWQDYATLMTKNVGPRPNERIQFIQDMIDEVFTQDAAALQDDYDPPTIPSASWPGGGFPIVSNPHGKYTDDSSSPNYGRTRLEVQLLDLAEGFLN